MSWDHAVALKQVRTYIFSRIHTDTSYIKK